MPHLLEKTEIKHYIQAFYQNNTPHFDRLGITDDITSKDETTVHNGYCYMIHELERDLAYKSQFEEFTKIEKALLDVIKTSSDGHWPYSDLLVNTFKNIVKECNI